MTNLTKKNAIITIDGPSGAGKGTVAYRLASHLGLGLLDSGALYRIVGLLAYQAGLLQSDEPNEVALATLTQELKLDFKPNPSSKMVDIYVNNEPLVDDIRNEFVGSLASKVAVFAKVREALLNVQRNMGNDGVVADGRDMGTVVFPMADVKVFLTATATARADRRVAQLLEAGKLADYDEILADIVARDERDENRAIAPSRPAEDALVIDSSSLSADEVFAQVIDFCHKKGIVR